MKASTAQELLKVKDVMSHPAITAPSSASVRDLAKIMDENEISGLAIVDDQERPIGVVSRTDLLRRLLEGAPGARRDENFLELLAADSSAELSIDVEELGSAEDLMTPDPVVAKPDESLARVAHRMAEERVHRVIVVDADGRVAGVVTTLDVLARFPN